MIKSNLAFFIAFIFGAATPSTSDLIDEANAQFAELRSLIEGKIASTQTKFSAMTTGVSNYGKGLYNEVTILTSTIHQQTVAEANQIKEAAQVDGIDIASCAKGPEEMIDSLRNEANLEVELCINTVIEGASNVLSGAVDRVNGLMNRVLAFRFRIASCNGVFICVAPIVEDLELAKIEIPQEIDVEFETANEWMADSMMSMERCADDGISYYRVMVSVQIDEVAKCVG